MFPVVEGQESLFPESVTRRQKGVVLAVEWVVEPVYVSELGL